MRLLLTKPAFDCLNHRLAMASQGDRQGEGSQMELAPMHQDEEATEAG